MPSPKIKISIPASLKLSAAEKTALKRAFQADAVRILSRHAGSARNDIVNILPSHPKAAKKKASKKAGKKGR